MPSFLLDAGTSWLHKPQDVPNNQTVVPFAGCWDILGVVRHRRMQEGAVVRQPILCHARDSAALPWQADGTYQLCKPN